MKRNVYIIPLKGGVIQMTKKLKQKIKQVFEVEVTDDMNNINNKLHLNYIIDLKKLEVDRIERAKIIQNYMKKNLISFNDLSKQLQISKSTLSGWLRWVDLTEGELATFKKEGMTETEITTMLKRETPYNKEQMLIINLNNTQNWIKKINNQKLNNETLELVRMIRNNLSTLLYRAEK